MLTEYATAFRIDFALPLDGHSGALQTEVDTADTAE